MRPVRVQQPVGGCWYVVHCSSPSCRSLHTTRWTHPSRPAGPVRTDGPPPSCWSSSRTKHQRGGPTLAFKRPKRSVEECQVMNISLIVSTYSTEPLSSSTSALVLLFLGGGSLRSCNLPVKDHGSRKSSQADLAGLGSDHAMLGASTCSSHSSKHQWNWSPWHT